MRKLLLSSVALIAMPALADPVVDTRKIMAGTVTTTKIKNEYISGARDGTAPFKGALSAYKAVRAAEPPLTVKCADGTVIMAPGACPAPPPVVVTPPPITPSPTVPAGAVVLAPMPDINIFPAAETIVKSYIPGSNAADMVGAFRLMCGAGQLKRDDPLLYPGKPGSAHLHQFYGNLAADAYSNFESLRAKGNSTCGDPTNPKPANRSAYWIPALLDGKGSVIQPETTDLYYKRWPKSSTDCTSGLRVKACAGIPNGLAFIWGYDMPKGQSSQYPFGFYCGGVPGNFYTLAEAVANGRCPAGSLVYARSDAPSCWDGKTLIAADRRSNLTYMYDTHLGYSACPSTHPVHIPALTLSIGYRIVAGDNPSMWRFSSDEMHPELPAGSTMHADYWEAWEPTVKAMWQDNCIDKILNCNGGALGNGYSIPGADTSLVRLPDGAHIPAPRLVPIP